jgi:RHS repeat-associated protein
VKGSESYTQNWDFDNRLLSTAHSGGGTISYLYDAAGIRIGQTAPGTGTLTSYLVDENTAYARVLAESTGSTVTSYDYGADLARMDLCGGTCYYYIYDGLGSTRALADNTGTVQQSINYDAYGQPDQTSPLTSFLFNGQQYDPLTKLYYLRARYYNPFHGRFLSQDPFLGVAFSPPTLHRYGYSSSDPANRVDPSGRVDEEEEEVVGDEEAELTGAAGNSATAAVRGGGTAAGTLAAVGATAAVPLGNMVYEVAESQLGQEAAANLMAADEENAAPITRFLEGAEEWAEGAGQSLEGTGEWALKATTNGIEVTMKNQVGWRQVFIDITSRYHWDEGIHIDLKQAVGTAAKAAWESMGRYPTGIPRFPDWHI